MLFYRLLCLLFSVFSFSSYARTIVDNGKGVFVYAGQQDAGRELSLPHRAQEPSLGLVVECQDATINNNEIVLRDLLAYASEEPNESIRAERIRHVLSLIPASQLPDHVVMGIYQDLLERALSEPDENVKRERVRQMLELSPMSYLSATVVAELYQRIWDAGINPEMPAPAPKKVSKARRILKKVARFFSRGFGKK